MVNAVWFVLGGMAIVFATLCVLLAVMMGLGRLLRPKPRPNVANVGAGASPSSGRHGAKTGGA
ncbi:MAG: hypothetical protein A2X53_21145 [Candidatus Rokubacteria bacterium GWA2_70_23]|nr:MAG: hypothetical protein A2X53_21145 [Candidatus Rokubacteria bacterium GWA2_70_23]